MSGKQILLGVTGGIAVYKAADLVRRLQRDDFTARDNTMITAFSAAEYQPK